MNRLIYLDYSATTPCDSKVVEKMCPYFYEKFGNPNSLHKYGEEALEGLNNARSQVSELINASFDEIVFTSGATESNKIALMKGSNKKTVVTTKTEHKSIFNICQNLEKVIFLDVRKDGLIELKKLEEALRENIGLVSICMVNNETGALQDIKRICEICHASDILVHTDATQAFGKINIDVKDLEVDFLSASGHKIYGPKGIGILYFKKKHHRLLRGLDANNDVEFGIRAGTVPVALCVGMGEASEIANNRIGRDLKRIKKLRELLINGVKNELDEVYINGSNNSFYPGIVNISLRGCEGEALMMESSRICVASGSACTSNKLSISHVLDAMGIIPDIAQSSIRISIGRHTTEEDIKIAIKELVRATIKLRAMSPVWEMIKAGIDIDSVFSCRR